MPATLCWRPWADDLRHEPRTDARSAARRRAGVDAVVVGGAAAVIDLGRPAVAVVASPPHTRPRVAVAFAEGACVCWPAERHIARFAADIFDPVIGLTRDGLLVAAGRQRVAVYQASGTEPQLLATDRPRAALPVSILSAPGEGCFAILYADGLVQVMKCST